MKRQRGNLDKSRVQRPRSEKVSLTREAGATTLDGGCTVVASMDLRVRYVLYLTLDRFCAASSRCVSARNLITPLLFL